jgi:hypothetical protein
MALVTAINHIDADHLAEVIAEMQTMGAPMIRCVETGYGLVAIEGSHRLAAAAALGLTPTLVLIDADEIVEGATLNDIRTEVYASYGHEMDDDGTATSLDYRVAGWMIADCLGQPVGATYQVEG